MDPYQQNQGAPGGNPYEFILNPEKYQKPKRRFSFGQNNFIMKLVLIIGGTLLLMLIVSILINTLTPKKVDEAALMNLAQTQNELVRISDQGSKDARQQVTKNLATTMQYTMATQQKLTLQPLGKVGKKELSLKQKASIDQRFASAKATSTFDTVFAQVAEEELNSYASELKNMINISKSAKDRDMLSDFYKQTQQLVAQIPYTQDGIEAAGQ